MSNVLIGIIGVILFIGLALAGALFLGQRFQESSNLSKASDVTSRIAQSINALHLYNAMESDGPLVVGAWDNLTTRGYMKSRPSMVMVRGLGGNATGGVAVEYMVISSSQDATYGSDGICAAAARQIGMQTSSQVQTLSDVPTSARAGCFKLAADWGNFPAGSYLYFQHI